MICDGRERSDSDLLLRCRPKHLLAEAGKNHKEKKPMQDLMNMDEEELLKWECTELVTGQAYVPCQDTQ
jgi:hypothetical protein